ncbi:MAG: DUF2382 domain-containing protein [Friedmanniella sp.]
MSLTTDQARTLAGSGGNVVSTSDGKVGSIGQIYLDDATGEPSWITVKTGLFGTSESFVPLQNANVQGDDVVVSYAKDKIKDAPRVDPDGSLSPEEEDRLYDYYGLGTGSAGYTDSTTGTDTGIASGYVENSADADYSDSAVGAGTGTVGRGTDTDTDTGRRDHAGEPGVVGHDTSGPTTDDAMTLSEERLRVGTTQREAGRARLRKYVVTENVTQTVPVSHEEVRIEREPITDANRGAAESGPAISEEEHEVVLHAEVPVVDKDVEAVERVRLDTETVTDQETVTDEVRKERVDLDEDARR